MEILHVLSNAFENFQLLFKIFSGGLILEFTSTVTNSRHILVFNLKKENLKKNSVLKGLLKKKSNIFFFGSCYTKYSFPILSLIILHFSTISLPKFVHSAIFFWKKKKRIKNSFSIKKKLQCLKRNKKSDFNIISFKS